MRKKELVLEVITETLESLNEENEIIRSHPSTIPQIELDMILENIRKLYANYRLLDKYNQEETEIASGYGVSDRIITIGFEKKKDLPEREPENETIAKPQPEPEPEAETQFEDKPEFESGSQFEPEPEPEVEAEAESESEPEPQYVPWPEPASETAAHPVKQPEEGVPAVKETETVSESEDRHAEKTVDFTFDLFSTPLATIADKYRKEEKTINEQISSQESRENIASQIQHTPITELKAVIGLNDKFIFINELFHGNMKAYQETIHSLDQLTTLNDAIRYFTEVKDTFDMNEDLDSFRRLAEMIQRKFRGEERQ